MSISYLVLSLFILNLGTAFGAGLYETQLVLPHWFPKAAASGYRVDPEAMHRLDSGRKFWAFVTTVPLTLLTLANVYMALQTTHPGTTWWLAATLITLVERLSTFAFFIPTIIRLQRTDQVTPAQTNRMVSAWLGINYIRNGLTLLAFLLALKAFSLVA
ncbi:anthrone oxygenase family protein [Fibrella arboris]|uniref:anthrone oxygenase family protein n=1 Tax=Fibrella arboris TaxID=3242486 RepID=UPI0035205038